VRSQLSRELKNNSKINALVDRTFIMGSMQGTLMQLLVSRLDVSLRNEKGEEIKENEGMAESFLKIIAELLPARLTKVQKQAEHASPKESLDEKQIRERTHVDEVTKIFEAIKQNDANITNQAIETFTKFVKNKKSSFLNEQGYLTDTRYSMDLLHLIYVAFDVLSRRGGELPGVNAGYEDARWYGSKADSFCFKIIGGLQLEFKDLSSRLPQILNSEVFDVFIRHKKVNRGVDVVSSIFRGEGSDYLLGNDSYYDDHCSRGPGVGHAKRLRGPWAFAQLIKSNNTSIQNICTMQFAAKENTLLSNNVGPRRR
jgi:6-pyruvoyl-tetrahydropterin synthase